jgi:hypothetical protein
VPAQGGVLGALWRVKYTTVGTHAGGTTFNVDITTNAVASDPLERAEV